MIDYLHNSDVWMPIVSHSSPIVIRALSITSKKLNEVTGQFKVALVLENKDIVIKTHTCFLTEKEEKVFDDIIIKTLTNTKITLNERVTSLKNYIDNTFYENQPLLHYSACSLRDDYSVLDLLLKACPNLNIICDTYSPTPLFSAMDVVYKKETPLRMLIEAGADWRIKNPVGDVVFGESFQNQIRVNYQNLIEFATNYWKQLNRENTPIPSREFTINNLNPYLLGQGI